MAVLFDDAMVSMSYARTLVDTGEWVWYPGADRVQGFTNPLWTLWMAALHGAGLEGTSAALAVSATGIGLLLFAGYLTMDLLDRSLPQGRASAWVAVLAGAGVPFLYPLAFWTLRGMEVGWLTVVALLMLRGLRDWLDRPDRLPPWLAIAGGLGILTRLDFVLVAIAIVSPQLTSRAARRQAGILLLTWAGVVVCVVAGQQWYYGDWLPNTYRLKLDGEPILPRVWRGVVAAGKVLPVITLVGLFACAASRSGGRSAVHRTVATAATRSLATAIGYGIWTGGDAWEWTFLQNRHVSVVLPLGMVLLGLHLQSVRSWLAQASSRHAWSAVALMAASGLGVAGLTNPFEWQPAAASSQVLGLAVLAAVAAALARSRSTGDHERVGLFAAVTVALVVAAAGVRPWENWISSDAPHVVDDLAMVRRARGVAAATTPDATVATVWAGIPAYVSRRTMVDVLGKNDRVIANGPVSRLPDGSRWPFHPGHSKWNYAYSIGERRPDVVLSLWLHTDADLAQMEAWGYTVSCLSDGTPIWVARDSPKLRRQHLLPGPCSGKW